MKDQYYKINDAHINYKGERYFRFNPDTEGVVTVVINNGTDSHRGRGNNMGVYIIHRVSFLTNYLAYSYAMPCSKQLFDKKFNEMVKRLK